jgi:hypothetical protein
MKIIAYINYKHENICEIKYKLIRINLKNTVPFLQAKMTKVCTWWRCMYIFSNGIF